MVYIDSGFVRAVAKELMMKKPSMTTFRVQKAFSGQDGGKSSGVRRLVDRGGC